MITPCFIERLRLLPYTGQVTVQQGDWVTEEQTVARIDYMPGRLRRFQAASQLRISGAALRQRMLLPDGAPVRTGQPVAASFCFGERRVVTSPYDGFLGLVSRSLGHVYIREPITVGSGEPEILDVPTLLGVRPLLVGDCLRVSPRATVIPGQVIATRRVERQTRMVQSSIYGKVASIEDGVVTIRPLHVRTELGGYVAGRVTSVLPGQGVVVRAYASLVQGQYGIGGETGGQLLLAGSADSVITPDQISPDWQDKVIVIGATASLETIQAAAAAGARALIMAHLPLRTLLEFSGGDATVGLTGDEDVPLSIVLTEGFGEAEMAGHHYQTLQALAGRYAAVNGTTHIRAGVIRPEVIVCEHNWPTESVATPETSQEIQLGMMVRIIRQPQIGLVGRVVNLPSERQQIATGSLVRVAEVESGADRVLVPVSNLVKWVETEGNEHD